MYGGATLHSMPLPSPPATVVNHRRLLFPPVFTIPKLPNRSPRRKIVSQISTLLTVLKSSGNPSSSLHDDSYSGSLLVNDSVEDESPCVSTSDDYVDVEIEKVGRNRRRIYSQIKVEADLQAIWNVLTDYERLTDFIPGLVVCRVIEKKDNFARLFQIGQQSLKFGIKFNAEGILDCYENDLQYLHHRKKRDIEFKMIEGSFQIFEGKWSIEQNTGTSKDSDSSSIKESQAHLSYVVDVKPKMWLPVGFFEGWLIREIKLNLSCIREEAKNTTLRTL